MKRVIVIGDTHCGAISGLTPPQYDSYADNEDRNLYDMRRSIWGWFADTVRELKPDICIANGDLIDGSQGKSGGQGLLVHDRLEQAKMATHVLKVVGASKYFFTYGTPYHTGDFEDYEQIIADEFGCQVEKEVFVDVDGTVIHATHHASGSVSTPHTRQNALGTDAQRLRTRYHRGSIPKVDVFVRSHLHYAGGFYEPDIQGWRVPSLQLAHSSSRYGRRFQMELDYGFLVIDVYGPGAVNVSPRLWHPPVRDVEKVVLDGEKKRRQELLVTQMISPRSEETKLRGVV